MPALSIALNSVRIVAIDAAGIEVIDVAVHGALDREALAVLDAHGGNFSDGGCGYLIWVPEQTLVAGDVLTVTLQESVDAADQGRTTRELYPDEESSGHGDFTFSEELASELRARPRLHEAFAVLASTSSGQQVVNSINFHYPTTKYTTSAVVRDRGRDLDSRPLAGDSGNAERTQSAPRLQMFEEPRPSRCGGP